MLRRLALPGAVLLSGCAAPAQTTGGRASSAVSDSTVVVEVNLRRSAELADSRGTLRVFDQDLRVEYRRGGRGPGLDAGEVTLEDKPLRRVEGKGGVSYQLGRDLESRVETREDPWVSLTNAGGPGLVATLARVKLAPFPVVTQPVPGQAVLRTDELAVVMLPPVSDVWYRVTMSGIGDVVTALDMGQGRWLFPRGTLERLAQGRARIVIEVETSCGDCEVAVHLRASWSSRGELEVPVTLL